MRVHLVQAPQNGHEARTPQIGVSQIRGKLQPSRRGDYKSSSFKMADDNGLAM